MNYEYTPEEVNGHKEFEDFCREEISGPAEGVPQGERLATLKKALRLLGQKGYLDPGRPMLASLPMHEAVARASASVFAAAEASAATAGRLISVAGSPAQKAKHLPGIVSGESVAAFAVTEAGSASDAHGMTTAAEKTAGGWVLRGAKTTITNAPDADLVLVLAVTDAQAGGNGLSLFIVPRGTPGVSFGAPQETMGLKGASLGDVTFEGCELPEDAVLGNPGDGQRLLKTAMTEGCIRYAAFSLGIARALLDRSLAYSTEHKVAGKPIFRNQEISFKLADMYMLIDTASQLTRQAAWLYDGGDGRAATTAMAAKLLSSESAGRIAHMALQVHGGGGYLVSTGIERMCRDVRYAELAKMSSELLRVSIARDVLESLG